MGLNHRIRKIWHEAFYRNASQKRIDLALRCQEVTSRIDLRQMPSRLSGYFRFWLHLSLCQACKNYYEISNALSRALKKRPAGPRMDSSQLNETLLKKYARVKKRG